MGNGLWKRDGNEYLFVRDGKSASRVAQGPVDLGTGTTEGRFSDPRNRTLAAKQHAFEKCLALLDNRKEGHPIGYPSFYPRARAGWHKVQWTLALARPRGALALREIEPKLRSSWVSRSASHFSITKKDIQTDILFYYLERETGIEPATPSLARRCSTTEPLAQTRYIIYEKI